MSSEARRRVLVIDDQRTVRDGLVRLIRNAAHLGVCEVRTAATPAEAMRELRVAPPDVVLLDVDLAGEDGLALLPCLVQTCRVIVLTSHADAPTRARAARLGAHMFTDKMAPASALLAQLARLLPATPRLQGDAAPT
jgi:two-component system, NarL family, nitrate/nitrite response regulator NarL